VAEYGSWLPPEEGLASGALTQRRNNKEKDLQTQLHKNAITNKQTDKERNICHITKH
jgi:hypothetical protein